MGFVAMLACKGEPPASSGQATPAPTDQTQAASTTEPAAAEAPAADAPAAELAPTEAGQGETGTAAPAEGEPVVETPSVPPRFWVALADGIKAHDVDGKVVASLAIAGDDVRRLADGRFVVYEQGSDHDRLLTFAADGKPLRSITLPLRYAADCSLVMPKPPAKPTESASESGSESGSETGDDDLDHESGDWPMRPQDAYAFGIDSRGTHACLNLQDRNDNMADMGMLVAVDLQSGKLRYRVTIDVSDTCHDKGDLDGKLCRDRTDGAPWIEGTPTPAATPTWAYEFDEKTIRITGGKRKPLRVCAEDVVDPEDAWGSCGSPESRSPSGRWVLISGHVWDGDYIHRELALIDRSDGKIWQVLDDTEKAQRFIEVTPTEMFDGAEGGVLSVVGESEIEWLPDDRLWVDGQLLIPERREVVSVGGSLVRTQA